MFARDYRLPAIEIPAVFHDSKKLRHEVLDIRFRPAAAAEERVSRCAVIVSTRVHKHASTRNRIKRLLRVVWYGMVVEEALPHGDYVLIAKSDKLTDMHITEVEKLIAQIMQLANS